VVKWGEGGRPNTSRGLGLGKGGPVQEFLREWKNEKY